VYAIKGKGAHIKKGVNRKKNRKRTGKKSVRSLVVLVEHSTTRNVNRNRERDGETRHMWLEGCRA
jgi:hypothetical protein